MVQFKIKRHTPLSKLMKAYCERQVTPEPRFCILALHYCNNVQLLRNHSIASFRLFLLDANYTALRTISVPDTWLHFYVCCVTSCRALRYGRSGSGSMASLLMRRIHLHRYGTMVRLHLYFLRLSLR